MSDVNDKCLEVFPLWLASLGNDLRIIVDVLKQQDLSEDAKRYLIGAVNYLFKSLDLIPDGIDDIGYLDDAFVLRLAAKGAVEGDLRGVDTGEQERLVALSKGCALLEDFLGEAIYHRLDKYTRGLRNGAARGRMVDELIANPALMAELMDDAERFISEFQAPKFAKDEKNLIKLTAFFEAKLPK